jgi:hypothetical protein
MARGACIKPPLRREDVGADEPIRLDVAAVLAFPDGSMTVSGLRREASRGRLTIERIAGKDYTTLRNIERMRLLCRVNQKERDCGSNPPSALRTARSACAPHGSSATDRGKSARAALEKTARTLNKGSPITSPANTRFPETGAVIRLKS